MDIRLIENYINNYLAEQRVEDLLWFYSYVERIKPEVIVEIGCKEGGHLGLLSNLIKSNDGLIVGIDQADIKSRILWNEDNLKTKPKVLVGSSHDKETFNQLKKLLGARRIDMLFIDGDHSYEGMLLDYDLYKPLVRTGGIIAVHDIHYLEDVRRAWDSINERTKIESPKIHSSIGIGLFYKE